jgi:dipeptidyl aminopeptidase/acylaminoacyl peptidase
VTFSPDGDYVLAEYLVGPWSHEVAWWRFASEIEVWDKKGNHVATVASLPLADQVPAQGVAEGPRQIEWRPTADHELYWIEALDGGDPVAEADHRDRLMRLGHPFTGDAEEVFRAEHRVRGQAWGADDGTLMLIQRERMRRWLYTWLLDVEAGTARLWFDQDESDRYNAPGWPVMSPTASGQWVMRQDGDHVYFSGSGATDEGDRPFLDRRNLSTGEVERLFRSPADRYESFSSFAGDSQHFIMSSESPTDVPNYYLATFGEGIEAAEGEAIVAHTRRPITRFEDPTPALRQITKRIVRHEREDGVALSFTLCLPPGYEEGDGPLPTVVYAYPLEYGRASSAGQVRGSAQRFSRFWGPTHMYFLLRGYAVLDNTAMPMIGDP